MSVCPGSFIGLACPVELFSESLCGLPVCFVLHNETIAQVITMTTTTNRVEVWPDKRFDNTNFTIADPIPCMEFVAESKNETLVVPSNELISNLTTIIELMRNGSLFIPRIQASQMPVNSPASPVWVVEVREPRVEVVEIIEEDTTIMERTAVVEKGDISMENADLDAESARSEPQRMDQPSDMEVRAIEGAAVVNSIFNPSDSTSPVNPVVQRRPPNPQTNQDTSTIPNTPLTESILSASHRHIFHLMGLLLPLVF
jgi:hypothetical protein